MVFLSFGSEAAPHIGGKIFELLNLGYEVLTERNEFPDVRLIPVYPSQILKSILCHYLYFIAITRHVLLLEYLLLSDCLNHGVLRDNIVKATRKSIRVREHIFNEHE